MFSIYALKTKSPIHLNLLRAMLDDDFEIMDSKSFKPEKAKRILEEHGMQVTLVEAKATLDFLNSIANAGISTYLEGKSLNALSIFELRQLYEKQAIHSLIGTILAMLVKYPHYNSN